MLDLTVKDVHPLSDFKRRTAEFLGRLRKHRRPLLLTLNGRAEMVVLNAQSYQELIDRVKKLEAEAVAGRTALRAKAV